MFKSFGSLVARDLTKEQIADIVHIKCTMSHDEYAGYSPLEQAKFQQIRDIVGDNEEQITRI